jgi:aconitate hydratase
MKKGLISTKSTLSINGKIFQFFQLSKLHPENPNFLERLPFSIRILLEGVLRNTNGESITEIDANNLAGGNLIRSIVDPSHFSQAE